MKLPVMRGLIDRRILINYTADPAEVQKIIPAPFRPKLYQGKAIVGICLIRLQHIRPGGWPAWLGVSSENGAHRVAVEWEEGAQLKEGVFVPRRDTSLKINALVGGRLFPGRHQLAKFTVREANGSYRIAFRSRDKTQLSIAAQETTLFPATSVFENLANASAFFEGGSIGYSPNGGKLDGLRLATRTWQVQPLSVSDVQSSFFEDEALFSKGSVVFDNALLMRNIEHEWHGVSSK